MAGLLPRILSRPARRGVPGAFGPVLAFGLVLALGLVLAGCAAPPGAAAPDGPPRAYGIEIIVRTGENIRTPAEAEALVDLAARHGVSVINLLVKQDEDRPSASGEVYYRSAIAPAAPGYAGFDALAVTLAAARARGLRLRAWLPQFHDQAAARRAPAWQMMAARDGRVVPYRGSRHLEYFVNPLDPAVQDYQLSLIGEVVDRYPVDGVMLDWIRFDDYPMDLGDDSRRRFAARHGQDPLEIDFRRPGPARERWNEFRTDGLAAYVARVRQRLPAGLHLGVYILPPEFVEVGQDAAKFSAAVHSLGPMCYFRDWGYPVDWLWSSCLADTARKAGGAEIVPAMDADLADEDYRRILGQLRQRYPQIRTLAWFHHGQWSGPLFERVARISSGAL